MTEQPDDPTIGKIVADITRDLNVIVQHQVDLAKREVVSSAKVGGIGAAMFVVAAFLGLLVIIFTSAGLAHLISMTGLHLAWCYLIVAGAYVVLAAILVLVGWKLIQRVRAPRETIRTAKQLPTALKGESPTQSARSSERIDAPLEVR